jgi:hypothetical protein
LSWLGRYHSELLKRNYSAPLYDGVGRLESLWLLLVGGAVGAALDISLDLSDRNRVVVLAVLMAPGALWALYLLFHEVRSIPSRYRRHRSGE